MFLLSLTMVLVELYQLLLRKNVFFDVNMDYTWTELPYNIS